MTMTSATALGAGLRQADGPAALRLTGTQACWLCGTHLQATSMVPDGGSACADVHWYCADILACTQRWTRAHRTAGTPGVPASGAPRQP
jgi:hypothetical protein